MLEEIKWSMDFSPIYRSHLPFPQVAENVDYGRQVA